MFYTFSCNYIGPLGGYKQITTTSVGIKYKAPRIKKYWPDINRYNLR